MLLRSDNHYLGVLGGDSPLAFEEWLLIGEKNIDI